MPLYEKLLDTLRASLDAGEYGVGDQLPTELELCRTYGVSRSTVRAAVLELVREGRLVRVKGRGTFVTRPKVAQGSIRFIESYYQEMRSKGLEPRTRVLACGEKTGSARVCERLGLAPGTLLFRLRRLRYVRQEGVERPMVLTTVYLPAALTGDLSGEDFEQSSLYDVLALRGVTVQRARRVLEVKLLHGNTAQLLEAPENAPAHFISSIGYDETGHAVEYSESFYPADRNQFIIEAEHSV